MLVACALAFVALMIGTRAVPPVTRVLRQHVLSQVTSVVFVGGVALAVLFLSVVAIFIAYASILKPVLQARSTRYYVTNRRVLIQRGREELHLERERIAYVIDSPWRTGGALRDLFLVLDGPRARAFSSSGAFGERRRDHQRLVPMFSAIDNDMADAAAALLFRPRELKSNDFVEETRGSKSRPAP
jgi:hypothetical protein